MEHASLARILEKLKASPRVKGVFTTGSTATALTPSSDIDLVVVLDKNAEGIKSVYTLIESRFADVFFFDVAFVNKLKNKKTVSGNTFDGMFVEWLTKGKVEYDPQRFLQKIKSRFQKTPPLQKIPDSEKRDFWIKANYNYIANARYFNSGNTLYHAALEIRLLYSVLELITTYFSFRGIPWRGEKFAITYLQKNDRAFLAAFRNFSKSSKLPEKMKYYRKMFDAVLFGEYQKWRDNFVVAISSSGQYDKTLNRFWDKLVR